MCMAHERRPLALASSSQELVVTLVIATSSQADPVYFLITKAVREPIILLKVQSISHHRNHLWQHDMGAFSSSEERIAKGRVDPLDPHAPVT